MSVIATTSEQFDYYLILDTGKTDANGQPITMKLNIGDMWSFEPIWTVGGDCTQLKNALQPILEYNIIGCCNDTEKSISE